MSRHVPVARITAVAALAVGVWVVARGVHHPRWRALAPGIEFWTLHGEPYCRRGSAAIGVLRLDPARARLRVHAFDRDSAGTPPGIVEWQHRTGATAVFNAGQYYEDYSYMGLLVSFGDVVSRARHPTFKAALAAHDGRARVIDLEHEPAVLDSFAWTDVAQSFMLFDRRGELRVRRSDQVANRTAVAEDRIGRLLVFTTEGGYTLSDFARFLREAPLDLTHAMAMDGGFEAELCVKSGRFHYASFGTWNGESSPESGARTPLPAVIAVQPR